MKGKRCIAFGVVLLMFLSTPHVFGQEMSNYLILSDIDGFRASKNPSSGQGPGILAGAGHFYLDHQDTTYRISYFNLQTRVGADVIVTQHAGADSDKWLLHELERDFRNYYGIPGRSYGPRQINGHTIMEDAAGGRNYRWLSGEKVVMVEYRDSQMIKSEPLEVVSAYLTKHASSLQPMNLTELRSVESKTIWIKDEMERRLWLCDKWFLQGQMGKVDLDEALEAIVKSMNVFLDYRQKYYNINAEDEKQLLSGYLEASNSTAIKNKLNDYRIWWNVNKTRSINLP